MRSLFPDLYLSANLPQICLKNECLAVIFDSGGLLQLTRLC